VRRQHTFCTVAGCGRPHKSRGYCQTHYMQFKRGAPITPEINTRVSVKPLECSEEGCGYPVKSKGLCVMHYARKLRRGYTKYPSRRKPAKPCRIEGCGNDLYSNGLCHPHYAKHQSWAHRGLSVEGYLQMRADQGDRCGICGKVETVQDGKSGKVKALAVDHDHETGQIRKLLCNNCNRGLGLFQDDPELLAKAADYLLHFRQLPS